MTLTTMQQKKERSIDITTGSDDSLLRPHESPRRRLQRTGAVGFVVALVVVTLVVIASPSPSDLGGQNISNGDDQAAPTSSSLTHRRGLMNDLSLGQFSDPKKTETVRREVVQQRAEQKTKTVTPPPGVAVQQRAEQKTKTVTPPPGVAIAQPQPQNRCPSARDMAIVNSAVSRHHTLKGNDPTIRYLTFGTSITWGAGLKDRMNAYPYVLSPCVKNVAIRASTSVYSALCAESLTGDDETFDVVVLEFHQLGNDGLIHLARRIRQRFPDAIVIFLRLWYPLQIRDHETRQYIKDWAKERDYMDLHSPEFHAALLESDNSWSWGDYGPVMRLQDKAAAEIDGHVLSLPRTKEAKEFFKFAHYISGDWHHLSERGHEYVAQGILQIMQNKGGVVREPRLGTWGSGDSCLGWFESGEYPYEHSSNVEMEQIDDAGYKHALSVPQQGGEITVFNPSDDMLDLYLTYMATGPAPSKYPRTEVKIVGSQQQDPVTINPTAPDYGHWVHVALTKRVARVKPGKSVVQLKPLEEEKEFPFRVTSTIVTGTSGVEGLEGGLVGLSGGSTAKLD